jgi:8-oxo-dGTP pyrophosphatase MutT (NUDIX family)
MKWTVHDERIVYVSAWVRVALADVSFEGGRVPEHHVVRVTAQVAGAVVVDPERDAVLMLYRHRFITGSWGYEVPAGRIEAGETPVEAAAREVLEETGHRPGPLEPLIRWHPSQGLMDQTFHSFLAESSSYVGAAVDVHEAERIEWVPTAEVARMVDAGEIVDGFSVVSLLAWLRRRGA